MASKLKQVPRILEAMNFTSDEMARVLNAQKQPKYKNKFAAEIAIELGMVSKSRKNKGLVKQADMRVKAAKDDLEAVSKHQILKSDLPEPFLGRDGVASPSIKNPTKTDVMVSISNLSAAMVSLYSDRANKDVLMEGAEEAENIISSLMQDSYVHPERYNKVYGGFMESLMKSDRIDLQKIGLDFLANRKREVDNFIISNRVKLKGNSRY